MKALQAGGKPVVLIVGNSIKGILTMSELNAEE